MGLGSDYLITPRDLAGWARSLGTRDGIGFGLMLVAGVISGLWLQDTGAGLFAAGLVAALWWHLDSRWAFGAALTLLVLIPALQIAYGHNWLYSGAALAGGLAVAVWYLLAIGVLRAAVELGRASTAASYSRARQTVAGPAAVPSWRRRLADIEAETRVPGDSRRNLTGVRDRRR